MISPSLPFEIDFFRFRKRKSAIFSKVPGVSLSKNKFPLFLDLTKCIVFRISLGIWVEFVGEFKPNPVRCLFVEGGLFQHLLLFFLKSSKERRNPRLRLRRFLGTRKIHFGQVRKNKFCKNSSFLLRRCGACIFKTGARNKRSIQEEINGGSARKVVKTQARA